jgi:NAD(P)-dependent dehydrogenase (short-subunit alcohol dehydrogenase family)
VERQLTTTLVGPMNVTRAVLPVMRRQRSGHVITISSSAGLTGFEFGTAYAASKFGIEGWMESLRPEVAPFGIHTTIVNPGFFRTELLTPESTNFAQTAIDDYTERRAAQIEWWTSQNGQQSGDPAKLAQALVTIANEQPPRRRFIAGADSIASTEQKVADLQADIDLNSERFVSLHVTESTASCRPASTDRARRWRCMDMARAGATPFAWWTPRHCRCAPIDNPITLLQAVT